MAGTDPRIKSEDGHDEVWGDIGDMWRELGEIERARHAYERAYEIDPSDGEWTGNLRRIRRTGR